MPLKFNSNIDIEDLSCSVCKKKATVIAIDGSFNKKYPLCIHCKENVIYPVRVITIHKENRAKYNEKLRKYVMLENKKKSSIRFELHFNKIAVKYDNKLNILGGYHNVDYKHIFIDQRNALDYLLDNPPHNVHGIKYTVVKTKTRKLLSSKTIVIRISDSQRSPIDPYNKSHPLSQIYEQLNGLKATGLQRLTKNKVAIYYNKL